jgi:hypothetical protein
MSYRELFSWSLVPALVAGIAVFTFGGGQAQSPRPDQPAAEAPAAAPQEGARVTTPYADITVQADQGKVRVEAPYSSVSVDADGGRVRVRAPWVNLDVRW